MPKTMSVKCATFFSAFILLRWSWMTFRTYFQTNFMKKQTRKRQKYHLKISPKNLGNIKRLLDQLRIRIFWWIQQIPDGKTIYWVSGIIFWRRENHNTNVVSDTYLKTWKMTRSTLLLNKALMSLKLKMMKINELLII